MNKERKNNNNKKDILQTIFSTLRKVSGSLGALVEYQSEGLYVHVNALQHSAFIIVKMLLFLQCGMPF